MAVTKPAVEPLISLRICSPTCVFQPGDRMQYEYQIDAVQPADIQAVEVSVMWYTEGKGDEDLGVHHFERYTPSDAIDGDLRQLHCLETTLPPTPLSYNGAILKIRWCVRIRLFWGGGKETTLDRVFQLLARPRSEPSAGT
jgi:hypothetical protein